VERRTSRYSREVSRPTAASRRRRLLALALAAVAIGLVVLEPFPKGEVLLSLTDTHGVDTGDIPALATLLVAAYSSFVHSHVRGADGCHKTSLGLTSCAGSYPHLL
jgi:hypothetical protein